MSRGLRVWVGGWTQTVFFVMAAFSVTTALAEDSQTASACLNGESRKGSGVETERVSENRKLAMIAPAEVDSLMAGRLLVDVRPRVGVFPQAVPGALRMDILDLQILVRRDQREVLVFGAGDDDGQLARRLARWPESERMRLVAGGAPAIALQAEQVPSAESLSKLLLTAPVRALAASINDDLQVLALDDFESRFLPLHHRLPQNLELNQPQAVQEITSWLSEQGLDQKSGLLLVDSNGKYSAELAPKLSLALGRPVFFINGGGAFINAYGRQFANMNRQPRNIDRGCQG